MIYLNNQPIKNVEEFSARFGTVLSMIDGGKEWLMWAIADNITPSIYASDESQLLNMIQSGMYNSMDIQFNCFRANINKILTLNNADVQQLAAVRNTANDNENELADLLMRNNILSYAEMYDAATFISSGKFDRKDLFQFPSFSDMLALTSFVREEKAINENLKTAAYKFAQDKVVTIPGFIDMANFYESLMLYQIQANKSQNVRNGQVQAVYTQLSTKAPYLIFTPTINMSRNENTLRERVSEVAGVSRFIGFLTITSCIANLASNINVVGQDAVNLQTQIDGYLLDIKRLVSITPASSYNMSQDGALSMLKYENNKMLVMIGINNNGNVFILPESKKYPNN